MKESITRLIFKKRRDARHLKSWRPISLLNVDNKIISKAITIRLSKVIESTRECAILVNLDQEKAFDLVDRSFLLDVLRSYGFGPYFCHWIFTFYHGAFMKHSMKSQIYGYVNTS